MNEAVEEHHLVHVLIAELKKLKPSDDRFDAKFNGLGELVKHHVEEEEGEILPEAEKSDLAGKHWNPRSESGKNNRSPRGLPIRGKVAN